jgi:phage tail-like protein
MNNPISGQFRKFNFVIELGGDRRTVGGFQKLSGLSADRKLIGMGSQSPVKIMLKRGLMCTDLFNAWRVEIEKGQPSPRAVNIVFRDEQLLLNINNAWPTKIQAPALEGKSNDVEVESIQLTGEGLTINPICIDD